MRIVLLLFMFCFCNNDIYAKERNFTPIVSSDFIDFFAKKGASKKKEVNKDKQKKSDKIAEVFFLTIIKILTEEKID